MSLLSIKKRLLSFKYAFQGLRVFALTQPSAWVHILASIVSVAAGFYFSITSMEWVVVVLAITLVLVTEALNTSIEFICDHVTPEQHPMIGKIKKNDFSTFKNCDSVPGSSYKDEVFL